MKITIKLFTAIIFFSIQAGLHAQKFKDSVMPANPATKMLTMQPTLAYAADSAQLSALNAKFIKKFLTQDAKAHNDIIHRDFVCIEGNGAIVQRDEYMKNWTTDFDNSGYTSFTYKDEHIRIFGNTALVRSKTVYTKNVRGKKVEGNSIYTDTYIKENGKWLCIQAQITPVKTN